MIGCNSCHCFKVLICCWPDLDCFFVCFLISLRVHGIKELRKQIHGFASSGVHHELRALMVEHDYLITIRSVSRVCPIWHISACTILWLLILKKDLLNTIQVPNGARVCKNEKYFYIHVIWNFDEGEGILFGFKRLQTHLSSY